MNELGILDEDSSFLTKIYDYRYSSSKTRDNPTLNSRATSEGVRHHHSGQNSSNCRSHRTRLDQQVVRRSRGGGFGLEGFWMGEVGDVSSYCTQ